LSKLNIAAYGGQLLYPPELGKHVDAIAQAGWTSLILRSLHVEACGTLRYNQEIVVREEAYVGAPTWPCELSRMLSQAAEESLRSLLISVGDEGGEDFANVESVYRAQRRSLSGTTLQRNFIRLHRTLGAVDLIELAPKEPVNMSAFLAFARMLADIGYGLTLSPGHDASLKFWTRVLQELEYTHPGQVRWWNLPRHAGEHGFAPADWAYAIRQTNPGLDTDGYLMVGDRREIEGSPQTGDFQPPAAEQELQAMEQWLASYGDTSIGGSVLCSLDRILGASADSNPADAGAKRQRMDRYLRVLDRDD